MDKKLVYFISIAISLLFLIFFNHYSLVLNETNHTGINTYIFAFFFSILFVSNIVIFFIDKRRKMPILILGFAQLLILISVINVIVFEKLNIMMWYDLWLKKGMP